jgi:transcriptional regulator GlxA family with amidase domain
MVQDYAADLSQPRSTAKLARYTGVSVRTLQNISWRVSGQSVMRYVRQRRLELAHQMLTDATPDHTTVTHIAFRCGFYELGRFAVAYRHKFGRSPSTTLRYDTA